MAKFCTQTRTDHVQDICWFYVYMGRRYEINDFFHFFRHFAAYATWLTGSALGRWLPGCSVGG